MWRTLEQVHQKMLVLQMASQLRARRARYGNGALLPADREGAHEGSDLSFHAGEHGGSDAGAGAGCAKRREDI